MIHMPVQDKRIDSIEMRALIIGVGVGRGLPEFAFSRVPRTLDRMKTLFGEKDPTRLTAEKQLRPPQVTRQHLQILKGDARRIVLWRCRSVFPCPRFKEVL